MSKTGLLEELDQVGRRVILVVRLVVERGETIEGELERVLPAVLLAVAELNAIDEELLAARFEIARHLLGDGGAHGSRELVE